MTKTMASDKQRGFQQSRMFDKQELRKKEAQTLMEDIRKHSRSPSPLKDYKSFLEKTESPWKPNKFNREEFSE